MKTPAQLDAEIAEMSRGVNQSKEYKEGLEVATKAAEDELLHYGRSTVEASLDQVRAAARSTRNDFFAGQVAGYELVLSPAFSQYIRAAGAGHRLVGPVKVDTSAYRRTHGAEPRGFGNWTFSIGRLSCDRDDDPAIYRPAEARGARKGGLVGLPYSKAREYAVAEAKRRGINGIVGVCP